MSKNRARSGSMLLKFSNTSVTSARASYARNLSETNGASQTNNANNANINKLNYRRKFFNSSTEIFHVLNLMLMSMAVLDFILFFLYPNLIRLLFAGFCRRVTNTCYIQRRLIIYANIILIGGLLKDFASVLLRALFFSLSPRHVFNTFFVKFAWAWNVVLLVPLVALSSEIIDLLNKIAFDEIEKSIEEYHERKQSNTANTQQERVLTNMANQNKTIVTLQSLSSSYQAKLLEEYQSQLLRSVDDSSRHARYTWKWFQHWVRYALKAVCCKDICRLLICSGLYLVSMMAFGMAQLMSTRSARGQQSSGMFGLAKSVSNSLTVSIQGDLSSDDSHYHQTIPFDISGHVFILVFSNLIFIEECSIMSKWESMGDRLTGLSQEFLSLEPSTLVSVLNNSANRRLFYTWLRYRTHATIIRVLFGLITTISLLWDFMLIQTALFYHTMIEKLLAFIWALLCWYISYYQLFPFIHLPVRKILPV